MEGREEIRKVVTGVSACQELFVRAREAGADAVLVHHGLFWEGMPRTLTGFQFRRVAELIRGEMSLLAYHLPLDRHLEVGNNAVAGRALGLARIEPFGLHDGLPLGVKGLLPGAGLRRRSWSARCRGVYGQEPLAYLAGPRSVSTLGIISGGGQGEFYTAIDEGLDAYVTGEVTEWVMNVARETGIHYLAAGHYATERLGVTRPGRAPGGAVRDRGRVHRRAEPGLISALWRTAGRSSPPSAGRPARRSPPSPGPAARRSRPRRPGRFGLPR